ncbi:MAG: 2-C-methyl-D-erythritol 4-phosphate cytidylyltransferase [Eubacteriales bacterium]|nr:2-C-methyl-D-erythritol 4-phosphate cytidylyltransferase [Eubacteriales bacterium]
MGKKRCTAIVLAAGQGKRMGTKIQKQYLELLGKPVLWYALDAFERSELIDGIILVAGAGQEEYCRTQIVERYGFRKVQRIVSGGKERYHSVHNGLLAIEGEEDGYVLIHDGARPFVDGEIIRRTCEAAERYDACVAGMPVKDTIKIADEEGFIRETPKRSLVWQIQTPQAFSEKLIRRAYRELIDREAELLARGISVTDDAMVVEELCGHPVRLVEGSYENIKITTPEDLRIAEALAGRER